MSCFKRTPVLFIDIYKKRIQNITKPCNPCSLLQHVQLEQLDQLDQYVIKAYQELEKSKIVQNTFAMIFDRNCSDHQQAIYTLEVYCLWKLFVSTETIRTVPQIYNAIANSLTKLSKFQFDTQLLNDIEQEILISLFPICCSQDIISIVHSYANNSRDDYYKLTELDDYYFTYQSHDHFSYYTVFHNITFRKVLDPKVIVHLPKE